jgi:hypothetical protein
LLFLAYRQIRPTTKKTQTRTDRSIAFFGWVAFLCAGCRTSEHRAAGE